MSPLHASAQQSGSLERRLAILMVMFFALAGPVQTRGQWQPTSLVKSDNSGDQNSSTRTPQFYDEPQFTVAGVADTTNLGGHGSDTVMRTKEALAKDTVSLGKPTARD